SRLRPRRRSFPDYGNARDAEAARRRNWVNLLHNVAIPANMSAWGVAQRKAQPLPDDLSRHFQFQGP
ncbi:MAG: hypothetical protein WCA23_30115, partial [Stellaceae bacterium]